MVTFRLLAGVVFCPELDRVGQAVPGSRVTLVPDRPFVQMDTPPELGRFHRYWNKARKAALRPSGR